MVFVSKTNLRVGVSRRNGRGSAGWRNVLLIAVVFLGSGLLGAREVRCSELLAVGSGLPEAGACESSVAPGGPCPESPCRDVWVVSTRGLPDTCRRPDCVDFGVQRLDDRGCRWEPGTLTDLLSDPARPLVIFVHGNRYDADAAREQGLRLADRLGRYVGATAGDVAGGSPRTVVFSWPSDQQGILVRDSRRKYDRAFSDGLYLSWLLGQIDPERPLGLVGYSFGGLVTLEALADRMEADSGAWADRPGRTHLALVTPAVRSDALLPGGPYRAAVEGIDRLTLLINSRDRALRFFRFVDPAVGADALGFVGMSASRLPAGVEYAAVDAAPVVGREHSFRPFLDSRPLASRIVGSLLGGLAD